MVFCFADRINKMNGATGMSDIEGKAATGSGERGGSRTSFNKTTSKKPGNSNSVHSVEISLPNSRKIYVNGQLHPNIRVPFREILLAPTKTFDGKLEINEPVRVYDTSGPWGDPKADIDVTRGLPALRAKWIRDRGDVKEIEGRMVRPIDDGYLSEKHAASRNGESNFKLQTSNIQQPRPLRARAGRAVTQLWYARQGIITPEMEFIAIRENGRANSS